MTNSILDKVGTRLGFKNHIPPQLVEQIPEFKTEELSDRVLNVLNKHLDGVATLSEILIWLYKVYSVIYDRQQVCDYIHHTMIRKGMLEKVSGMKSTYKITNKSAQST